MTITVPGAVRSWGDAHRRFGRLPREQVLAPAIELARDGFPAWDGFISSVETTLRAIEPVVGSGSGFEQVFRPQGRRWTPGELVRLPALAATLERIATAGFDDFYEGDVGERQARGLAAAGCGITFGDLRAHTSTWGDPIATAYRGVRVTTHPPNSSGIVALELLNVLEQFPPPSASSFGPSGVTDPEWIHLAIEAAKLVMADRDAHLTDADFMEMPVERLLSKDHASDLATAIRRTHAAPAPAATVPKGGGTIYLATVDGDGNAVSLIESNYMGFGSGVVDPDTGIHYQNRGSFFSPDPSHPNVLAPGKRTLHTLIPAMLFRPGEAAPWVVTGQMGGDAQPQILAQVVSALVDGSLSVMRLLKMLPGTPAMVDHPIWIESIKPIASEQTGIFYPLVAGGTYAAKGMILGYVTDYVGRKTFEARAPEAGIVLYICAVPSMKKGDTIANIGVVASSPP